MEQEIIKYNERAKIIGKLKERNLYKNKSVIAIDGDTGTGKSNLSYFIGSKLAIKVINFDDFVSPKQDCYVNAMNLGILRQLISLFYRIKPLVVEGVCLIEILEKLNIQYDILIYAREVSETTGNWSASYRLDIEDENILKRVLNECRGADVDIVKYHYKYRPFEKADYIYQIINQLKL